MDWLDLLAVQGTLESLLQHHSSKASILRRSAFFMVQLSHPYMTTGKTIALTRRTFVGKVMSLFFNMLSRLVIIYKLLSCLVAKSCPTLQILHELQPSRILCPWDFPGKNTGVGCHFLLQGIFRDQGLNLCLVHWQADFLPLSHRGSPYYTIGPY